jgi:hypothetical protein
MSLRGAVLVHVKDVDGKPCADVQVTMRYLSNPGSPTEQGGAPWPIRTGPDGVARFDGTRCNPGIGVRVELDTPLHRPKHGGGRSLVNQWFSEGVTELVFELVVEGQYLNPLAVRFKAEKEVDDLFTSQTKVRVEPLTLKSPISYLALPDGRNPAYGADEGSSRAEPGFRVVTGVRTPGRYFVLLVSLIGELSATVDYDGAGASEFTIAAEMPVGVKATIVTKDGQPLDGAVVFTSGVPACMAWAIGLSETRRSTTHMSQQITRKGRVGLACQPRHADPRNWSLFHPELGVCDVAQVEGDRTSGYRLVVEPSRDAGAVRVGVARPEGLKDAELTVCVTPVFAGSGGAMQAQALVGMGRMQTLTGDSVTFQNLPAGSYMVVVILKQGRGQRALGPKWSAEVTITRAATTEIALPLP